MLMLFEYGFKLLQTIIVKYIYMLLCCMKPIYFSYFQKSIKWYKTKWLMQITQQRKIEKRQ